MTDREPSEISRRLIHIKNKPLLYWVSIPIPTGTSFDEARQAAATLGLDVRDRRYTVGWPHWIDVKPKESEES